MTPKEKGAAAAEKIKARWALAKAGQFEELPPEQIRTYEYIHRMFKELEDIPSLENLFLWGPTGVGKSRSVRTHFPGFYWKPISKWWDGYKHEDVVVIEDIDPERVEKAGMAYWMKIWGDHYVFNAEVKGGMIKARPKLVIVTSNYSLEALFPNREDREAIRRRFKAYQWWGNAFRKEVLINPGLGIYGITDESPFLMFPTIAPPAPKGEPLVANEMDVVELDEHVDLMDNHDPDEDLDFDMEDWLKELEERGAIVHKDDLEFA